MYTEQIEFYSEGCKLVGVLKMPDDSGGPWPIIVHGPGWLETVGHPLSVAFHEGLVGGGYAVLQFDYRGFGESEGEPGWIKPHEQQIDIHSAIAFAATRDDLDIERLGLFAFGGIGGGNAIYVAAAEPRVKAICSQTIVADGPTWFRQQRREYEWVDFLKRVESDNRARVLNNDGEKVDPTEELMVATPERKKKGMPTRGKEFHLASADHLMRFKPVQVVDQLSPAGLLLVCIENDVVTPEDHAWRLYEAARAPKRLLRQVGVNHYEAYTVNYDRLMAEFLAWYDRHLIAEPGTGTSELAENQVQTIQRTPEA